MTRRLRLLDYIVQYWNENELGDIVGGIHGVSAGEDYGRALEVFNSYRQARGYSHVRLEPVYTTEDNQ